MRLGSHFESLLDTLREFGFGVRLRKSFGIRTLLLEGGGKINGSFLAANLIDELSILVAPVAACR